MTFGKPKELQEIIGRVFVEATVELDGYVFTDCTFRRCTMIYRGRDYFGFIRCESERSPIALYDAALGMMQALAKAVTDDTVLRLVCDARAGRPDRIN